MRTLLAFAAVGEAATGVVLLLYPPLAVRLLLGEEIAGAGTVVCRVAGIALIGLGLACRPGPAQLGMLAYSGLATLYFAVVGLGGVWVGTLLWPAVILHAVLTLLLARALFHGRRSQG